MNNLSNSVQLIGNLGADPVIREFENGKMARFSMATKEVFKNRAGEKQSNTHWHKVVAWGRNAELVSNMLEKGKRLALQGRLHHRSFDDKDGNTRYITEVVVNDLMVLN